MTFLQQQTEVGRNIKQAVTDDTLFITETEVKDALNYAQDYLDSLAFWPILITESTANTVSGTNYVSLPTNYRHGGMISVEVEGYTCDFIGEKEWARLQQGTAVSGRPTKYTIYGGRVYLWPTPATSVTGGAVMRHYKPATDLSGDSDTCDLPAPFQLAMVDYATAVVARRMGNNDLADRHMALWNAALPALRKNFGSQDAGGFPTVTTRSQQQPINPNDYPTGLTQA